jgi:protein involved in polysaccharide export with SLBB domain
MREGMNLEERAHEVTSSTFLYGLLAAAFALGMTACSTNPPPASTDRAAVGSTASLRPGDAVQVAIWREPDLSGKFQVDEQGVVTFPLLGPENVEGIAPDSLQKSLVAQYTKYVVSPSIKVTLLRRVAILGQVQKPGLYPVDATMTLSDALALAGGVGPDGNENDIRLIRNGDVVRQTLSQATVVGASPIRSGDQIVVGKRSWFSRNLPIVTSLIGAAASISVAFIIAHG